MTDIVSDSHVIMHLQHDMLSIIISRLNATTLHLYWDEVPDNYQTELNEIEHVLKAIMNSNEFNKPAILIEAYDGISFSKEALKLLQFKEAIAQVTCVAVVLKSSTQRLSLNLYSTLNRSDTPIKGFMSKHYALQWLRKKQAQLEKKK